MFIARKFNIFQKMLKMKFETNLLKKNILTITWNDKKIHDFHIDEKMFWYDSEIFVREVFDDDFAAINNCINNLMK